MFTVRAAAILLAFLVCGCGRTGSVSGLVTYKSKPVVAGRVTAVVGDQGPRVGVIQPDGSYRIEGIPAGSAKLAVESPDPSLEGGGDGDGSMKKARPAGWIALPEKYADVKTAGLTVEVRRRE